jgi:hypothetical protein
MRFALRCSLGPALLFTAAAAYAQVPADATLTILATDPAPGATLARQQSFYVQFEVKNPAPVVVTVNALYKGEAVHSNMGTSGMARIPAGGGIGVTHFFYWGDKPTRIDEVRLKINAPMNTREGKEFAFPVDLTWTAQNATAAQEFAPWVREWQQAEKVRQQAGLAEFDRKMDQIGPPAAAVAIIFQLVMGALLLAGCGLPLWGALKWQGYWRVAASVLGAIPLLALANIIIGVSIDRTSHNLWPFELGILLAAAGGGMSVLLAVRWFLRLRRG